VGGRDYHDGQAALARYDLPQLGNPWARHIGASLRRDIRHVAADCGPAALHALLTPEGVYLG